MSCIIEHESGAVFETRWVGRTVVARQVREGTSAKTAERVTFRHLMSEPAGLRKGR